MARTGDRNEMLENEKMAKQETLRGLFVRLSDEVERSGWAPGVGGQITQALAEKKKQLDTVLQDRSESDRTESRRRDLQSEYDALSGSAEKDGKRLTEEYKILGAVLFEQRSSGTLDPAITLLDSDWEEYSTIRKEMQGGLWKRIVRGMDKSHFDRSRDEKYHKYGTGLFEAGQEDLVKGENAEGAVGKIRKLRASLSEKNGRMSELEKELDALPPSTGGTDDEIEELRAAVWALKANHGEYLYDNGQKWLREDTPSSVMDLIEEILGAEKEIEGIDARISGLSEEMEKDELRLLIAENRKRVEALEEEKSMLDEKILSLMKEIERMEALL